VVAALYAFFAVAAGARAGVQLGLHAGRAPVAYTLSAVSAVFYLIGAAAFRRAGIAARTIALIACAFELLAVVAIGALTVTDPARWGDATVWSAFGAGYGYLPLLLPLAGLVVLTARIDPRRGARRAPATTPSDRRATDPG
jgi:hypothetical protein